MKTRIFDLLQSEDLVHLLKDGGVGVIPTDTIYGLSASVEKPETIERLYAIRNRDRSKPFIVLISSLSELDLFGITLEDNIKTILARIWPAPVSIILPCNDDAHAHIHRGVGSIAFRVPAWAELRALLQKTGPLVTTSVNPAEQQPIAYTIDEARVYFGDQLDFYVDVGRLEGNPSTLMRFDGTTFAILRQGAYHVEPLILSQHDTAVVTPQ